MPGVLIIEALAQTGAVAILSLEGKIKGKVAYFGAINQAKFKQRCGRAISSSWNARLSGGRALWA